jgi:glycosyltransferase involved in cell wall biosynthesis
MQKEKVAWISFLGNALLDSRIVNLIISLKESGITTRVTSFDIYSQDFKDVKGDVSIFRLERKKPSFLFYFNFARMLCSELRKSNADIYFAEDIYTLPFAAFYAKIKKRKLIYNSRELYAFLGGHSKKKYLSFILKTLERILIRKCDLVLTTGDMDTQFLEKMYSISNVVTVRNIPAYHAPDRVIDVRKELNVPDDKVLLLYQGVLLNGRGIPKIFNAISKLPDTALLILGDGEQSNNFKNLANSLGISDRVYFYGMVQHDELINYTAAADIGLALIENISMSYYYALPNKLFEYIMAGLPVISCSLPQMKKIVEDYKVGICVDAESEDDITKAIEDMIKDKTPLKQYRQNCFDAAKELNWQKEFEKLKKYLLN